MGKLLILKSSVAGPKKKNSLLGLKEGILLPAEIRGAGDDNNNRNLLCLCFMFVIPILLSSRPLRKIGPYSPPHFRDGNTEVNKDKQTEL